MAQPPAYVAVMAQAPAYTAAPQLVTLHSVLHAALQGFAHDPTKCTAPSLLKAIRTNPMWSTLTKAAVNHELYEGEKLGSFVRTQHAGGPPTWSLPGAVAAAPAAAAPAAAAPAAAAPAAAVPPAVAAAPPAVAAVRFAVSSELPSSPLAYYDTTAGGNAYICLPEVMASQTHGQVVAWLNSAGAVAFEEIVARAIASPGMVMPEVNRLYLITNTREDATTLPVEVAMAVMLAQKTCRYGTEILECAPRQA